MKNILPLLLAAALGSAATYFIMDNARPAVAAPAAKGGPRVAGAPGAPDALGGQAPAADGQRTKGNFGGRTKNGGFLPEEIAGVSAEQMTKCRAAIMKTFRDEGVTAARNKVRDLRKELDTAKDEEKKTIEAEIADAEKDVHKAQKAALVAADPDITDDTADKVLAALEERMAQFRATKGGKGK